VTPLHIRFSQLTLNKCISITLLNIPWKWVSYIVILKNKFIKIFPHITQKPLCLHLNPIQSLLIHIDVKKYLYTFVYMYMYHNFLSLYSMFISLLIQFLKLSMK
jgi:hypothetical protein